MGNCIRPGKTVIIVNSNNRTTTLVDAGVQTNFDETKPTPQKSNTSIGQETGIMDIQKIEENNNNKQDRLLKSGWSVGKLMVYRQHKIKEDNNSDVELEEPSLLRFLRNKYFQKLSNFSFRNRGDVAETTQVVVTEDEETGKKKINEYIVIRNLGRGSHGKVKLCLDSKTDKLRAVKIIDKSMMKRMYALRRTKSNDYQFKKEIAILKKLDHPNVVKLFEVIDNEESDKIYLIFEYVELGPIMTLLSHNKTDRPPLLESAARKYMIDLIYGLEYLHEMKVVHRDIKPENLLIDKNGTLKLTDFGVSQMFDGSNDTLYATAGTPAFMSPEACTAREFSGIASDIWAVGVTLYVLLFGKIPFYRPGIKGIYDAILNDEPEFPKDINKSLKDLFSKLLEKNPKKRITLPELKKHPWITNGGIYTLINPKKSNYVLRRTLTEADILGAITTDVELRLIDKFVLMVKMKKKMDRIVKNMRAKMKSRERETQSAPTFCDNPTNQDIEFKQYSLPNRILDAESCKSMDSDSDEEEEVMTYTSDIFD